ncbi:uncharacterized protein HMPREF1541_03906 [Cyphellophora europaea CBS 101466]|uniref:Uncharacterized protein n=1 Tax=Cyphellophora europaea (strain CBS 101466) TaxID=1220924 RepID=W2RZW3_CYPE1|nr:uncharacterized protein HMPREF1541_03906 [Cyphellophora europaea CBS 101466]ETN41967.1 hypothetical protein HMPREF1541_03906 [Cyphellophora europaea CBS 101466]
MSSAADRLAAAKGSLESYYTQSHPQLSKRDLSAAAKEHLAQIKGAFESSHSPLSKRDLSAVAKEHLAEIKGVFEASHSPLSKRDRIAASAADRLAAAKSALEGSISSSSKLFRRDLSHDSAAQRLAAAKQGLEDAIGGAGSALVKRAEDDQDKPVQGEAELPVSNFQKTVMPIVIGLVLLFLFAAAASWIVWRRRQKNKAGESAEHRRKHLDLEDDGADEDYGFELPQNQRVQNVGFGGAAAGATSNVSIGAGAQQGRKRTGSLKEEHAKGEDARETNSKEFV